MLPAYWIALLCGLLPILAVNLAYGLNLLLTDLPSCLPYAEGCMSISRAVRSGPGLHLFRAVLLPVSMLMVVFWWLAWHWRGHLGLNRGRWMLILGVTGSLFLILYATFLGTDGGVYRWLRRYGVIGYFAGTAMAQLLLVRALWEAKAHLLGGRLNTPIRWMMGMIFSAWLLGCISPTKRILITDPVLQAGVENVIEWNFALAMSLYFLAAAVAFYRSGLLADTRLRTGQFHR